MGERAVEALLGGAQAPVEPRRGVLDERVQRPELRLQPGRVRDEVLAPALAQHGALVLADAPQAPGQRADEGERHQRQRDRAERHEPGRRGQVRRGGRHCVKRTV